MIADFATGRHAHAADKTPCQIGQNVTKHVFHHHDVVIPGPTHHVQRHGINIAVAGFDFWMAGFYIVKDLAEKGLRAKDIRLVHTGQSAGMAAGFAPRCIGKGKFVKTLRGVACNAHDIGYRIGFICGTFNNRSVMDGCTIEQPFGRFPDDNKIKLRCAPISQPLRCVGVGPHRPDPGIKLVSVT